EERRGTPILDAQEHALRVLHHAQSMREICRRSRERRQENRVAASKSDKRRYGRGRAACCRQRILRSKYALDRLQQRARTLRLLQLAYDPCGQRKRAGF